MKNHQQKHHVWESAKLRFPNLQTWLSSLGIPQTCLIEPLKTLGFKFGGGSLRAIAQNQVLGKFGRCVSKIFHWSASYGAPLPPPIGGVRRHLRRTLPLGGRCLRLTLSGTNQQSGGLHG